MDVHQDESLFGRRTGAVTAAWGTGLTSRDPPADAVIKASRHYWGTWDEYSVEAEELLDTGQSVFVMLRERGVGKGSRAPFDKQHPQLWTFRQDRIVRWESFQSRSEALEAAGLPECRVRS